MGMLLFLPLIGVQNDMDHAAEKAAHGKHPPAAPQFLGETQPHIDGGCQQHDDAAGGADQIQAPSGLRRGIVVAVILPYFLYLSSCIPP